MQGWLPGSLGTPRGEAGSCIVDDMRGAEMDTERALRSYHDGPTEQDVSLSQFVQYGVQSDEHKVPKHRMENKSRC